MSAEIITEEEFVPFRYLSVCSGIEAASVAWHDLGWEPAAFSEIEPFPSALLKHHYPTVPNLGDMTKFHDWPKFFINALVGGTPCQAFSVAGLREGLADPRGNLTLTFLGVAAKYRPEWVVWENVPGVLSDRTNAFGQFLAGLAELGYGWAYRLLDAQYFGLAQRRKRVFVVACLGGWERAAAVLFEPESLRGDSAPGRETGEGVAGTITQRSRRCDGSGQEESVIPIQEIGKRQSGNSMNGAGHGKEGDPMYTLQSTAVHGVAHSSSGDGYWAEGVNALRAREQESHEKLVTQVVADTLKSGGDGNVPSSRRENLVASWPAQITPTLNAHFGEKQGLENQHALGGGGCSFPPEISPCLNAGAMGRIDAETETMIPMRRGGFFDDESQRFCCCNCAHKFGVNYYPRNPTCPSCQCMTVDDLLQGDRFPAGTPLAFAEPGSPNNPEPIAFGSKDHGADAGPLSPTLRAGNHTASHANSGVPPAVAFHPTQDPITSDDGTTHAMGCGSKQGQASIAVAFQEAQTGVREYANSGTLRANGPGHDPVGTRIRQGMSMRRLTPTECERLQGFPDGYTNIPWRKKPESPDGPRYKALGNSMAVPCMRWLGKRIQMHRTAGVVATSEIVSE